MNTVRVFLHDLLWSSDKEARPRPAPFLSSVSLSPRPLPFARPPRRLESSLPTSLYCCKRSSAQSRQSCWSHRLAPLLRIPARASLPALTSSSESARRTTSSPCWCSSTAAGTRTPPSVRSLQTPPSNMQHPPCVCTTAGDRSTSDSLAPEARLSPASPPLLPAPLLSAPLPFPRHAARPSPRSAQQRLGSVPGQIRPDGPWDGAPPGGLRQGRGARVWGGPPGAGVGRVERAGQSEHEQLCVQASASERECAKDPVRRA